MADRQALVGQAEDHLGRDDEARQPERVHLRAADRRAARLARPGDRVRRLVAGRRAHRREPLRQLPRRAARDVALAGARVVDHLPRRQVARGEQRRRLRHRRGQREVARRDHADAALARRRVDLVEVVRGQPGRADDDADAALDRRERVRLDDVMRCVIDQHVDAVER